MKFYTDENCTDTVELNTLHELKAYALGAGGVLKIDFCYRHPMTGEAMQNPVVIKEEE